MGTADPLTRSFCVILRAPLTLSHLSDRPWSLVRSILTLSLSLSHTLTLSLTQAHFVRA